MKFLLKLNHISFLSLIVNNPAKLFVILWGEPSSEQCVLHFQVRDSFLSLQIVEEHESVEQSRRAQAEPINLDSCLRAFTSEEELGEDEMYYCSKCKTHCLATKKLDLWRLPPILVGSCVIFLLSSKPKASCSQIYQVALLWINDLLCSCSQVGHWLSLQANKANLKSFRMFLAAALQEVVVVCAQCQLLWHSSCSDGDKISSLVVGHLQLLFFTFGSLFKTDSADHWIEATFAIIATWKY